MQRLDNFLINQPPQPGLTGLARALMELFFFGLKEARACLFAGLFFLAVFAIPKVGVFGIPRYDVLLIIAVGIQAVMLWSGLETLDEVKAITLFHLIGFALEVFKTSGAIQAWRLLDLRIDHHPPYWMAWIVAVLVYANFFTHHFIGDYRWYIAALALGLYARSVVIFRPLDRDRRMPLAVAFVLIGLFIWLAENISTFFTIWSYPDQLGAWSVVHVAKWSSWSLLAIMTFTIVANLKHVKETIRIPS